MQGENLLVKWEATDLTFDPATGTGAASTRWPHWGLELHIYPGALERDTARLDLRTVNALAASAGCGLDAV